MNWLWPRRLRSDATLPVRVGRLLHWLSLAVAGYAILFCWMAVYVEAGQNAKPVAALALGLILALLAALTGRALRYLFAGE